MECFGLFINKVLQSWCIPEKKGVHQLAFVSSSSSVCVCVVAFICVYGCAWAEEMKIALTGTQAFNASASEK